MLASITPLGERSRGFSWPLTAGAFAAGAVLAGALGGAALGGLGSLLPLSDRSRTFGLAAVLVAVVLFDATPLRTRLPSVRRQVDEDWLNRFRGWVYGFAFGAQLGVGVATIVTSAAVYGAVMCALLCPGILGGLLVGAAFGGTRALSLLPVRGAVSPEGLVALHLRLTRLEAPTRAAVAALEALVLLGLLGALLW